MAMDQMHEEKEMSFLDHLEELRWHLVRSVIAVALFAIIAFVYSRFIFDYLILAPTKADFISYKILCSLLTKTTGSSDLCIKEIPILIQSMELGGQFKMDMMVSFFTGLFCAMPYVLWEIWRFIKPALRDVERKHTSFFVGSVSVLFFSGCAFGFYIVLPLTINFLGNYQVSEQVLNQIALSSVVSTAVTLVFATGLVFELPVLVYVLSKLGLVTPAFLRTYRKHSFVAILVVAAVITPPDVMSQILVSIPLVILYEISIFISAAVNKGK